MFWPIEWRNRIPERCTRHCDRVVLGWWVSAGAVVGAPSGEAVGSDGSALLKALAEPRRLSPFYNVVVGAVVLVTAGFGFTQARPELSGRGFESLRPHQLPLVCTEDMGYSLFRRHR